MLLLEEVDDHYILQQAREDLQILAKGQQPKGWQTWEAFEKTLYPFLR